MTFGKPFGSEGYKQVTSAYLVADNILIAIEHSGGNHIPLGYWPLQVQAIKATRHLERHQQAELLFQLGVLSCQSFPSHWFGTSQEGHTNTENSPYHSSGFLFVCYISSHFLGDQLPHKSLLSNLVFLHIWKYFYLKFISGGFELHYMCYNFSNAENIHTCIIDIK